MRKIKFILVLAAILSAQSIFAADQATPVSKDNPCGVIAKACSQAGFTRGESHNKRFWQQCMKPVMLGKTVEGVNVDPSTVQACRSKKIDELKDQLNELQNTSSEKVN